MARQLMSHTGVVEERRVGYPTLRLVRGYMEFHEIANVFPLMEGEDFEELVRDIEKNGQQQPILTYEGKILDGRNRYRACVAAGVEPWVEKWSGSSPVEAVLSLNLHRRHLSSGQRSVIAERMLPHLKAEAKKRQGYRADLTSGKELPNVEAGDTAPDSRQTIAQGHDEGKAVAQAAKLTGTNRQYVQDARKLAEEAPEMLERVERGEVTIPQAKRELGWSKPNGKPEKPPKTEPTVGEILGEKAEDLPVWDTPWDPPPERKEYGNIIKWVIRLDKLDAEQIASYCKDDYEAGRDLEYIHKMQEAADRLEEAFQRRRKELKPGNLRAVN